MSIKKSYHEMILILTKANKSGKPADKTAYMAQRNFVVKLNKEAKKSFLKNQITENDTNKTKNFWELYKASFTEKSFHYKQKFTLKVKRGVTSSETTVANIFFNHFVNITKSLDFPAWNPENYQYNTVLEKILETFRSHLSIRHIRGHI